MEKLLELPVDFWGKILDLEDISLYPADTPCTPDSPSRTGQCDFSLCQLHVFAICCSSEELHFIFIAVYYE